MIFGKKIIITFLFLLFSRSGICQDVSLNSSPLEEGNIIEENARGYYSQVFGYNIGLMSNRALYEIISNWIGTPYSYSGKSLNGIDCSGFVNMLYDKVYNISLSGNSAELFGKVTQIKKSELKEGNLVFFKIRKRRVSHVGIYLGENKFAHASTHSGVIISDLDEPYYKKYFSKGGKVSSAF